MTLIRCIPRHVFPGVSITGFCTTAASTHTILTQSSAGMSPSAAAFTGPGFHTTVSSNPCCTMRRSGMPTPTSSSSAGAPSQLDLVGVGMPPRRILQQGFEDTVVWNPGPVKAAALGDMPAEDWVRMVCVEAAVVQRPVLLAPGKTWRGMQRIEVS